MNDIIPQNIIELEQWMKDHCYNFNSYSINGNLIYEGFGLDNSGGLFSWYYTERGERKTEQYFKNEYEAVAFAFQQISNDRWAKSHMVGFTISKVLKQELVDTLIQMDIDYMADEIPYYGINNITYRVFVFGCDIKKVKHLKEIYSTEK